MTATKARLTGTFGKFTIGPEVAPDIYLCTCECGAKEKRRRNNISSARAGGRQSCCKRCQLKVKHLNHDIATVGRLGANFRRSVAKAEP